MGAKAKLIHSEKLTHINFAFAPIGTDPREGKVDMRQLLAVDHGGHGPAGDIGYDPQAPRATCSLLQLRSAGRCRAKRQQDADGAGNQRGTRARLRHERDEAGASSPNERAQARALRAAARSNGSLRSLMPVAARTALATAGAIGGVPGSPTPDGGLV